MNGVLPGSPTPTVLAVLGALFLLAGVIRLIRERGRWHPQARTWLLVGFVFLAVSAWLRYR